MDVGSGGLTFTSSVGAPAIALVLQLNFDAIDDVKRTTCGKYLQFKVSCVFPAMTYIFDFGDAPNYQDFTRSVKKAALLGISESISGVRNRRAIMQLMSPRGNGARVLVRVLAGEEWRGVRVICLWRWTCSFRRHQLRRGWRPVRPKSTSSCTDKHLDSNF